MSDEFLVHPLSLVGRRVVELVLADAGLLGGDVPALWHCVSACEPALSRMMTVAVLFVCRSGPYSALGCDVYDLARDARSYRGDGPVVAHPPCRAWGRLSHFAKPRTGERELALWAVNLVRRVGGIVEHPVSSRLWAAIGVRPGSRDEHGGLLIVVDQSAYGHRAQKRTGLYCVGCLPEIRCDWGGVAVRTTVDRMCCAERERTPVELARVLVAAAAGVRR